jgi:hypothetical protein
VRARLPEREGARWRGPAGGSQRNSAQRPVRVSKARVGSRAAKARAHGPDGRAAAEQGSIERAGACSGLPSCRENAAGAPREWRSRLLGSARLESITQLQAGNEDVHESTFSRRLDTNDSATRTTLLREERVLVDEQWSCARRVGAATRTRQATRRATGGGSLRRARPLCGARARGLSVRWSCKVLPSRVCANVRLSMCDGNGGGGGSGPYLEAIRGAALRATELSVFNVGALARRERR